MLESGSGAARASGCAELVLVLVDMEGGVLGWCLVEGAGRDALWAVA